MFTNQTARIIPYKLETQHPINWRYKKRNFQIEPQNTKKTVLMIFQRSSNILNKQITLVS